MVVTPNVESLVSGKKADEILNQGLENDDLMTDEPFLRPVSTKIPKKTKLLKKKKINNK